MATGYVETLRNIPLLLQLLFWYNAVLKALPIVRESYTFPGGIYLNNRGLIVPEPVLQSDFDWVIAALVDRHRRLHRLLHLGAPAPDADRPAGAGLAGVAGAGHRPAGGGRRAARRCRFIFNYPEAGRFNIVGGVDVQPEFLALLFGLSLYTAAFIAEVVRAGILAVARGQTEAAYSLGLKPGPTLRLIVVPQAMRVIIPPLTNQYLNLIKNSSLAVAIGYPDLVQVFAGTVLNQTGQAMEVDRHHHGGLSRHQPGHLAGDEHLQPAHGAGGTVRS